jgi:hypothetical protein
MPSGGPITAVTASRRPEPLFDHHDEGAQLTDRQIHLTFK